MDVKRKNKRIRKVLLDQGLTQNELAEILGVNIAELSVMLKYELAKPEQDEIIRRIKDDRAKTYAG